MFIFFKTNTIEGLYFQTGKLLPEERLRLHCECFVCLSACPVALISTQNRELTFVYQAFQTIILHAVPDKTPGFRGSPQKVYKAWPQLIHKNSS